MRRNHGQGAFSRNTASDSSGIAWRVSRRRHSCITISSAQALFIDMGVNAPRELQDSWRRAASQDAHGNRVPRRHGDRAHRGQERLSEPVLRGGRYGLHHHYCIWVDDDVRQSTNLPLPASRSPWTWSRAPDARVYVDAREQLRAVHRDQSAARTSAAEGMGVHQKWPDDVALVGIQDVMAMMGR